MLKIGVESPPPRQDVVYRVTGFTDKTLIADAQCGKRYGRILIAGRTVQLNGAGFGAIYQAVTARSLIYN